MKYQIAKNSFLYFNNEFLQKKPEVFNLYNNPVVVSNNTMQNNVPSLKFSQSFSTSVGYNFTNLFKQVTFNLGLDYFTVKNSFISNIDFNERLITLTHFQTPQNIEFKKATISIDKTLKKLKTFSKTQLSYSFYNFYNTINNGGLRKNNTEELKLDTFLTTFFQFPVNIEKRIIFNHQRFLTNKDSQNTQTFISLKSYLVIKPANKWVSKIGFEYWNTDLKSNVDFSFLDLLISYKDIHKVTYRFVVNNLLDSASFQVTQKNDYSVSHFQSQLLRRHFLISATLSL